ncbi:hypothetical protein BAE44_0012000, partial [Dichanthelium oligosanthes]
LPTLRPRAGIKRSPLHLLLVHKRSLVDNPINFGRSLPANRRLCLPAGLVDAGQKPLDEGEKKRLRHVVRANDMGSMEGKERQDFQARVLTAPTGLEEDQAIRRALD